jgi:hypothetical protein
MAVSKEGFPSKCPVPPLKARDGDGLLPVLPPCQCCHSDPETATSTSLGKATKYAGPLRRRPGEPWQLTDCRVADSPSITSGASQRGLLTVMLLWMAVSSRILELQRESTWDQKAGPASQRC